MTQKEKTKLYAYYVNKDMRLYSVSSTKYRRGRPLRKYYIYCTQKDI